MQAAFSSGNRVYPHLKLTKVNDRAADEYQPQPYAGRVAVIRSKAYFTGLVSSSLGWNESVQRGLEIHELPVYPKGMLVEPFCRMLAETLQQCMNTVTGN